MRPELAIAAAAALMALNGCAPQPALAGAPADAAAPGRQCFWADRVNSFASVDDRIVNVRVGVKEIYQFEMFGRCHDIDWSQRIAIVSRGGSSICSGLDAEIIAPTSIGPQRCPVRNVRKLTEAEVAALPPRAKP